MITFDFKPEKFLNAVAYFGQRCPGFTKKKVCKLLYYADKEHLLSYGSLITGDTYYRLPHGPIPTKGLDLLRGSGSKASLAIRDLYFEVHGIAVRVKADADIKAFSKAELRTLEKVCSRYGPLSADYLEKLSHKEPTWMKTKPKQRIDFELFFEGHNDAEMLKRLVTSEVEGRRILAPYRATS